MSVDTLNRKRNGDSPDFLTLCSWILFVLVIHFLVHSKTIFCKTLTSSGFSAKGNIREQKLVSMWTVTVSLEKAINVLLFLTQHQGHGSPTPGARGSWAHTPWCHPPGGVAFPGRTICLLSYFYSLLKQAADILMAFF